MHGVCDVLKLREHTQPIQRPRTSTPLSEAQLHDPVHGDNGRRRQPRSIISPLESMNLCIRTMTIYSRLIGSNVSCTNERVEIRLPIVLESCPILLQMREICR
jgi:hypothetical protein